LAFVTPVDHCQIAVIGLSHRKKMQGIGVFPSA